MFAKWRYIFNKKNALYLNSKYDFILGDTFLYNSFNFNFFNFWIQVKITRSHVWATLKPTICRAANPIQRGTREQARYTSFSCSNIIYHRLAFIFIIPNFLEYSFLNLPHGVFFRLS